MSKKPAIFFLGVIAALIFMLPATSMAKDTPPPLADVWLITAKTGQGSELYEAIEKHMASIIDVDTQELYRLLSASIQKHHPKDEL